MFPSPYLSHILDDAHRTDLLKQMNPPAAGPSERLAQARAAVARLIGHVGRSA